MSTYQAVQALSLYHFQGCPFCVMTRRAIKQLGLDIPFNDINQRPQYRAELVKGGGKAQVPCLKIKRQDGSTQWLYESLDIIEYLKEYKAHSDASKQTVVG